MTQRRVGAHRIRAAALVLGVLGGRACSIELAQRAYRTLSTGGEHSSEDLADGENLLVELGLLTRTSKMLRPVGPPEITLHGLAGDDLVGVIGDLAGVREDKGTLRVPSLSPSSLPRSAPRARTPS